MLNAVNINLVAFARFNADVVGMVFTTFTIPITVAEVALGLAHRHPHLPDDAHGHRRPPGHRSRLTRPDMTDSGPLASSPPSCCRPASSSCSRWRRRSAGLGRPAAYLSILFSAAALVAAIGAFGFRGNGGYSRVALGPGSRPRRARSPRSACWPTATRRSCWSWSRSCPSWSRSTRWAISPTRRMPSLGRYYAYQSLFAFSMMGLVLAPNFVQLFICWELVGLCSYLLIGYWYTRPEAARAAVKAFWITKAGDVGIAHRHRAAWRQAGTFDFLGCSSSSTRRHLPPGRARRHHLLHLLGAVGQVGAVPAPRLAPRRHGRPDSGLRAASLRDHGRGRRVPGAQALSRSSRRAHADELRWSASVGAFTRALRRAASPCVQSDIKRVLAYSTMSQLGYMMLALGVGAYTPAFFHLTTHAAFKTFLFMCAGARDPHRGHERHLEDGRARRHMPATALVLRHRHPGHLGDLSLLRLLEQGRDPRERAEQRTPAALRPCSRHRVPHRLLHVPRGVRRVLRARWPGTATAVRTRNDAHAHDAPALDDPFPALDPGPALDLALGIGFAITHPKAEFEAPGWVTPLAIVVAVAGIVFALGSRTSGARDRRADAPRTRSRRSGTRPSAASGSMTCSSGSTGASCSDSRG